jgi:hypothetical protein
METGERASMMRTVHVRKNEVSPLSDKRPRVVIVEAGFGGIYAANV